MKKSVMILFILFLFFLPSVLADPIDDELQKVTHYAEEYEIGNTNYVQLMVYLSSVRESLNEELGAVGKHEGGLLKQEQIRGALGEPNEETRWVWVEKEEHEMKLDDEVPIWKKIVFDGKKIQIRLSAFPSIFKRNEKNLLVYRLNFQTEFQKPEEKIDFAEKIDDIKILAEEFNLDPSTENGEALAKESVSVEKIFESYFRRNNGKCEDIMKSIFGSENQREEQKILVQEIDFYDTDDVQAIMRLEMCDECEWQWINLDMWLDSRGRFEMPKDVEDKSPRSKERYKDMGFEGLKNEVRNVVSEMKRLLENGDYGSAMSYKNQLWMLNDVWNEKSNNIWEEVQKQLESKKRALENNKEQTREDWRELEKLEKEMQQNLRDENYQKRKEFYLSLFEGYEVKEFYFEENGFEKRLVELYVDKGQEICDNFVDDNENGFSDCADSQCAGKICGVTEVSEGNGTTVEEMELYCISGVCQLKEDIKEDNRSVCGNHICEIGEEESCSKDCSVCRAWGAIECSGNVIFSGEDSNGCPLEPICIEAVQSCYRDDDCPRSLCGKSECVENKCVVIKLAGCQEEECVDGQKKMKQCDSGEKILDSVCLGGMWQGLSISCSEGVVCGEDDCGVVIEGEEVGVECEVREDCGGVDDVCSNGNCVTLPKVVEVVEEELDVDEPEIEIIVDGGMGDQEDVEVEELVEGDEEGMDKSVEEVVDEELENVEESEAEPFEEESNDVEGSVEITGGVIFNFLGSMLGKITGVVVDGGEEVVEESVEESEPEVVEEDSGDNYEGNSDDRDCPEEGSPPDVEDNCRYEKTYDDNGCVSGYDVMCDGEGHDEEGHEGDNYDDNWDEGDWNDDKGDENNEWEKKRREREKSCPNECKAKCEEKLDGEKYDVGRCTEECNHVCIDGGLEEFEKYFGEDHFRKEEKGVFTVGGQCRTAQQKTEGFVYFNGWGEPFDKIQPMKQKYYSGGEADWCKWDLENLKRQREEIEKGFSQEFAVWFFEKYLANSAEDWEQHVSGIFELYWNNVDNQMEMMHRMQCLGLDDVGDIMDYKLINLSYESDYGSLEYWEEVMEVEMPGMEGKVTVISPYMKFWIFPSKEFIKYEMQESMKNHEFPGSPEEKAERSNEEGLKAEEREEIKRDEGFMKKIRFVAGKYGGNLDVNINFVEPATGELVFNVYAQVNEQDILIMEPMLPEEADSEDVRIEIDFDKVYELIDMEERDMRGAETESPPWDRRPRKVGMVKNFINGVKMYFMVNGIISSAKVYPESAKGEVKDLFKTFFKMMTSGEKDDDGGDMGDEGRGIGDEPWEDKAIISGEVVRGF